jgi:hypothetical protein
MTISVKIQKENKDGSADALIRFDKEDLEILVQWGFVAMLKEALNEYATADQIASRTSSFPVKKTTKKKAVKTFAGGKPNPIKKAPKK